MLSVLSPPQRGQASVELVAVLPAVLLALAAVWQLALAGHAAWSAAAAARVAARAHALGLDPAAAARQALPARLERGLRVEPAGAVVEVSVPVPLAVGRGSLARVTRSARFEEQRP